MITLVSALFNIKREGMDGRTWEEYLKWFEITLKLKCPMILYVSKDVLEFVEERRLKIPTEVYVQTMEEVPYAYLEEKISTIINSDDYKNKILDPDRIECKYSFYSIIQFSKFKWLERAISENHFNSDYFFWIDAGASRFIEDYSFKDQFPTPSAVEALEAMGEKFLLQMNTECYADLHSSDKLNDSYLLDNRSYVCGTFFGGHKNAIEKVSQEVENVLLNKMIANNFVNNEQIVLGYLLKNKPEYFEYYIRTNWRQIALFEELCKK